MNLKDYIAVEIYGGMRLPFFEKVRLRYFSSPTNSVLLLRKMQFSKNCLLRKYCRLILERRYGIFVGDQAVIGIGLRFPHPVGIVIGNAVQIGRNCSIFQQVTIGGKRFGDSKAGNQPSIGSDCAFFSGSKVLGSIEVGDGVRLGANSVLTRSAVAYATYAGAPAKPVSQIRIEDSI